MDYRAAIEYLESLADYEKEANYIYPEGFRLDRMKKLARDLGNPQNYYPSVIIAGSKGKGSTAAILSSILRMENYRVGLYTSPHLLDVRERIQMNGLVVGEAHFADYVSRVEKVLSDSDWRKEKPTYFEVLTAVAFLHFREMKVHVAVLEVGLGGLYDSTNICEAKAVGITPISLEHTDKLGKTIAKIAVQKCGVIKGREYVVSAVQPKEAEPVILEAAAKNDAKLVWVGKDLRWAERSADDRSQYFDLKTPFGNLFNLELPLLGEHQIENAAMAVGLAKSLEEKARLKVSSEAITQGLAVVHWPGRMEKVSDKPLIVLDGAHTRDSVARLIHGLRRHFHFGRIIAVMAALDDKDIQGMIEELAAETAVLFATQTPHARSMKPRRIEEAAHGLVKDVRMTDSVESAIMEAASCAGSTDLVLVTGSLYLVAMAKKITKEKF